MPDFNLKPSKPKKQRRPPTRELVGQHIGRRATLTIRGAGSLRSTFHNIPTDLPPLCPQDQLSTEHSYAATGQ